MYCRKCGKQIDDSSRFCNYCGAAVAPIEPAPQSDPYRDSPIPGSASGPKPRPKRSGTGKKIALVVVVVFVLLGIVASHFGMSIPDMIKALQNGESLQGRGMIDLENAVKNQKSNVTISKNRWDTELCAWEDAWLYMLDYVHATPELYYVDIKNTYVKTLASEDPDTPAAYEIEFSYFGGVQDSKLEEAADRLLREIPSIASDWEKALLIHDALIRHVTYKEGPMDQTAYAALVEGEAVCMGYAMAYEYLLTKAGIECDTVAGYTSELAAMWQGTLLQLPGHAWNVVTFHDGGAEKSYYVDTTWDDPDMKDLTGRDYISHRWFCVTQDDLDAEDRTTMEGSFYDNKWDIDDPSMNYYVYTNRMLYQYDYDQVLQIMQDQYWEGSNLLSLRVADVDVYWKLSSAMENGGDLQRLMGDLGIETCAYNFTFNLLNDGLICFDIYLNHP